jgi:hypothetical protein
MTMTYRERRWALRLLGPCLLAAALAACSGGHEVVYRCDGTAESVAVTYRGEEGERVEETVSLPWETTFTVHGSEVRADLTAENLGDEGEMDCAAVVDGEPSDGSAESVVDISSRTRFSGNSSESTYDVRTKDRPDVELANDSPDPVCGFFIAPAGEDWGENLLGGESVDPDTSRTVTFEFEEGEYYLRVDTCDEALTFFNDIEVPASASQEDTPVFSFDPADDAARMVVTNASGGDLCGLFLAGRESGWSGSLFADDRPLAPGQTKQLVLPIGTYWFRAETCGGDAAEIEDFGISGNTGEFRWLITDGLTSGQRVTLTNDGEEDLCEFYITPEGEDWGENLLADYPLPASSGIIVTQGIDAERYDSKSHICDGSLIGLGTGGQVPGDAAIAITVDPRGDRPTLTIANNSSDDICGIHLDLGGGYLRNLLGDEPVRSGESWSAILGDGTYGVWVETCYGQSDQTRVDMSEGDQVLKFVD